MVSSGHFATGVWADDAARLREMILPADQVTIRETDFACPPMPPEEMAERHSINAVFICSGPRETVLPETIAERTPAAWQEGALAAKHISNERLSANAIRTNLAATLESQSKQISVLEQRNRDLEQRALASEAAHQHTQQRLDDVLRSTSWRMSGPLRRAVAALRRGRAP